VEGDEKVKVPIENHEGYEISEDGFVYFDGKKIKINSLPSGYRVVNIKDNSNRWRTKTLAHLVLTAFVGPRPGGEFEARHVNGKPSDCSARNLRWELRGQNRTGSRELSDERRAYLEERARKKEVKRKLSEFEVMQREMKRLAKELGME